ncbi:TIGR02680 family protein [Serinicoccus marinus]|uniref:TIGR02680 family protein n=1 Tax=Serinicoccus marinus TaxID=247333 RepID=UPI002492A6AA|nr:TIGR02680 family protein [Serinicoccus marinus]
MEAEPSDVGQESGTATLNGQARGAGAGATRFRLHRAGILNVWQYDEQVFSFAGGRMLLRGANGAGKSKTLEMLLPFALDGDKARMTASAKHHTSLLWLMTDGVDGGNRIGYVWVEFARTAADGTEEFFTCGVGIRASSSARQATAWHFVTSRRVGVDLALEDAGGPLSAPRLREVLGAERVFDRAADYKACVGRELFGLDPRAYDEVLRLLYWLRQPQVGEDIEPARLTGQLGQSLPQLDEQAVRGAADTFDELTAFGEQIDRRAAAATALTGLAEAYHDYAAAVLAHRATAVDTTVQEDRRLHRGAEQARSTLAEVERRRDEAQTALDEARAGAEQDQARLATLMDSPEFRDQRRLDELTQQAGRDAALADDATLRLERSGQRLTEAEAALARARDELAETIEELGREVGSTADALRRSAPGVHLATAVSRALLDTAPDQGEVETLAALERLRASLQEATAGVSTRRAELGMVRERLAAVDAATVRQTVAERDAERAEQRWETSRQDRIGGEHDADLEAAALLDALATWADRPGAPQVTLPGDLTPEQLGALVRIGADSAGPRLRMLSEESARAGAAAGQAQQEIAQLEQERVAVEQERDPAPPAPALGRSARTDGHSLWQVVDFTDGLAEDQRSGLEAALQSSGLLDAWVRPGGRLLDHDDRDIVLARSTAPAAGDGSAAPHRTLADALTIDLPHGSDLEQAEVAAVLAAVGLGPDSGPSWVCPDGRWQLGPAHGRAAKDRAQFIGATARGAERARRIAVLDDSLTRQRQLLTEALTARDAAHTEQEALEAWAADAPSVQPLSTAWQRVELLVAAEEREAGLNARAQEAAQAARAETVRLSQELRQLATELTLPTEQHALTALEESLRTIGHDLAGLGRDARQVHRLLSVWSRSVEARAAAAQTVAEDERTAQHIRNDATVSATARDELHASIGDTITELRERIGRTRASLEGHQSAVRSTRATLDGLLVDVGEARTAATTAQERVQTHRQTRTAAIDRIITALEVPGLPEAARVDAATGDLVLGLADLPDTQPVGRPTLAAVRSLAALSSRELAPLTNRLYERHAAATSGPAAEHQPALFTHGELHTVSGRDEAGEAVITMLAQRVTGAVERDRALLTQREKEQFERHVLGELGEALRRCRSEATELVDAMNTQLAQVSTSQGIRVRLDWRLRDDVAPEARSAVDLLTQPLGAMLPEERASLRDALHRLIEASRAQRPDLSYAEHLAAALDYRTWFVFAIRYARPEGQGRWERLHRRSPLSQGEQKVLCYLPLFAAAAAHFTTLAGAAPHAPRLVLLDDAFPKIDVRTHPLLFGLLVQLDLDFVVTSERLWGDHATVPSLAIYEALRDPGQRGIAQYEYRWNGTVLESVG